MAINKATLGKNVNGSVEYIYPKTSSDMVKYTESSDTTVKDKLDGFDDTLLSLGGRNYILGTGDLSGLNCVLSTTSTFTYTDIEGVEHSYTAYISADDNMTSENNEFTILSDGTTGIYARFTFSEDESFWNLNENPFTLSFEIKSSTLSSLGSSFSIKIAQFDENNLEVKYASFLLSSAINNPTFSNDEWVNVIFSPLTINSAYCTSTGTSSLSVDHYGISLESTYSGSITIKHLKLESGKSCTDWSLAPEDQFSADSKISTSTSEIVNNAIENLTTLITESLKDYESIESHDSSIAEINRTILDNENAREIAEQNIENDITALEETINNTINEKLSNVNNGDTYNIYSSPDGTGNISIGDDGTTISDNGTEIMQFSNGNATVLGALNLGPYSITTTSTTLTINYNS